MEKRILEKKVCIDQESIKDFYARRAVEKSKEDIDLPVVLCADKALEKVAEWNQYELKERFPLFQLNSKSVVLELGFGTGRISKYITPTAHQYVGIDYVKEFVELIKMREDVKKSGNTFFLHASLQDFIEKKVSNPITDKFNRFMISGGVLMYMNDTILKHCIVRLEEFFDEHCVIYISEPIALTKRLTLDKFYSDSLESQYSAIYRTVEEYNDLFVPLYQKGFKLKLQEEFFKEDLKEQKETRQWIFILER